MAFYLKRYATKDTPKDIARRFARTKALEQLADERMAKYPAITDQNVMEVAAWQTKRTEELFAEVENNLK